MQTVAQNIKALLANTSVTFASITTRTKVATAAAHKHMDIQKHTVANVQLFNKIGEFTQVYANAVKRSAAKLGDTNAAKAEDFVAQESNYTHFEDCYSLLALKTDSSKLYLYVIYNNAKSSYTVNGQQATKAEIAQYLTKSAAQKLLESNSVVHNKTEDLMHTVQVRTIKLESIVSITANKQTIVF
jgi:hypothetical protein